LKRRDSEGKKKKEKRRERSTYVLRVGRETVVDTRRQHDEILLLEADAHPLVLLTADIKVALSVQDVANLLVLVKVLVEERLYLLFVHGAHLLRGNGNLIAVLVTALFGDGIDLGDLGAAAVENAQLG
jgi:hypothetical protein